MGEWEPSYLGLYRSGELARRAEEALRGLADCQVCPRDCRVDRLADKSSICRTGRRARVASYFPHFGEEDCLRGWRGSGTIFFAWCNLRCVFCQNHDISAGGEGREVGAEELAQMMVELQARGCHNVNFVTPEHVVPQVLEGLVVACERGLRLPLVYNTGAYDSMESLRLLDGVIDIYMPDFKCWDPAVAKRLLKAEDYPEAARRVLREMHRQVGPLRVDERGVARRGVLVRHLVMPNGTSGTREVMRFLAEGLSPDTYVNIMDQYRPAHKACKYPEIARMPERRELREAYDLAREAGLWRFDERKPRSWSLVFAR
ncbi:MAG: radical SAM protein [Nitrospinota bacterium]